MTQHNRSLSMAQKPPEWLSRSFNFNGFVSEFRLELSMILYFRRRMSKRRRALLPHAD